VIFKAENLKVFQAPNMQSRTAFPAKMFTIRAKQMLGIKVYYLFFFAVVSEPRRFPHPGSTPQSRCYCFNFSPSVVDEFDEEPLLRAIPGRGVSS